MSVNECDSSAMHGSVINEDKVSMLSALSLPASSQSAHASDLDDSGQPASEQCEALTPLTPSVTISHVLEA